MREEARVPTGIRCRQLVALPGGNLVPTPDGADWAAGALGALWGCQAGHMCPAPMESSGLHSHVSRHLGGLEQAGCSVLCTEVAESIGPLSSTLVDQPPSGPIPCPLLAPGGLLGIFSAVALGPGLVVLKHTWDPDGSGGVPVSCCHSAEPQTLCSLLGTWMGSLAACWGAGLRAGASCCPACPGRATQPRSWGPTYVCVSSDALARTSRTYTAIGSPAPRPLWGAHDFECDHPAGCR